MLEQLIHHGVIVPELPDPPGLSVGIRGRRLALTPAQEEMALAWAAKKDTPYVTDPVFVGNFLEDFSAALGVRPTLSLEEIDFSPYYGLVDETRRRKEAQTKEERKALAAERKRVREELKAQFGYAIVNGQRVELGTYMVEPSGIFMGRGQHPLRGRWKQGARKEDITLNYGPGTPDLGEGWEQIVWQPESLWVARWKDKLTGKLKYIWLSDTAPVKQSREADKFDQALRLDDKLHAVRAAIQKGLESEDRGRRMVATACYLIDRLCLRVGDEKEADEADTVGATTLRPEHVTLHEDGVAEFQFLGKDSVPWHKTLALPEEVYHSLADLIAHARPSRSAEGADANAAASLPQLFPDITSSTVNGFFSRTLKGLSAKKFRTYHATKVVERSLASSGVRARDPEYKKWRAANLANLEAAQLCNHTKQVRGSWEETQVRYEQRILAAKARIEKYAAQIRESRERFAALQSEAEENESAADECSRDAIRARYVKRLGVARRRVEQALQRRARATEALGKIRAQMEIGKRKREWNTSTSLKSYVDPRVYQRWGERVDYDVLNAFFPTALRRKYAWVQYVDSEGDDEDIAIRPCLPGDLTAVAHLIREVTGDQVSTDDVRGQYLPELGEEWRVALIALGDEQQVAAFAALGPVYGPETALLVDCFALVHPDHRSDRLVDALAAELGRQFERFALMHPVRRGQDAYRLAPRDAGWYDWAPGLPERLGLDGAGAGDASDAED